MTISPIAEFDKIVRVEPPESPAVLFGTVCVLGGSIAGLLAARVLADHARTVLVIERDQVGADGHRDTGVPQDRQLHNLRPGGLVQIERWLPGITREAEDLGAVLVGTGQQVVYLDGRRQVRTGDGRILMGSRSLLESRIRNRVLGLPNVSSLSARATGLDYRDGAWTISAGGDAARADALGKVDVPEALRRRRWVMGQLAEATLVDRTVAEAFNAVTFMHAHPLTLEDPALVERAVAVNQQAVAQ